MTFAQQSGLVFPEPSQFIIKKNPNRKVSFRYLVIVAYVYGGVHALLWLLSKTVLTPLFQQLIYDRLEYHHKFFELLQDFNAKLATLVPFIPPKAITYESPSGSKYADAQTQTDEAPEKDALSPYSYYSSSVTTSTLKRNQKKKKSLVKFGDSADTSAEDDGDGYDSDGDSETSDFRTPAEKANSSTNEFVNTVKHASNRVSALDAASIVGLFNPVKLQLNEVADAVKALQVGDSSADSLQSVNSEKSRKAALDEVRKEIRSFKGSFLSARNFPTIRQ